MPKKLLVADDSLTIQKVIRLALSGAASGTSDGYEIQAVSDGNDAVQQISLFRPDIVLIDVSLPGKTAFEVKRAVNQHRDLDHVRFVLMSSAFEKVDEPQVSEVAFHGRLTKPFDPAHLREVLSQVLSKVPDMPPLPPPGPGAEPTQLMQPPPVPQFEGLPPLPPELRETTVLTGMPDLPESADPESDIRNLTESTIRMSGLAEMGNAPLSETPPPPPSLGPDDDFQWSVQENSLKPPSLMTDSGNSSFPFAPPPVHPNEHSRFITRPPKTETLGSELELTPPPPPGFGFGEPDEPPPPPQAQVSGTARAASQAQSNWQTTPPAAAPTFDQAQMEKKMEEVIRQEVEKALLKMARDVLPDVAERVIKQEIRRLLSESP